MNRFIWMFVIFGGGIVMLMLGFILLQKEVGAPPTDLRTPVRGLHDALAEWSYDKVLENTDDISADVYQKMFDDANGAKPAGARKMSGILSALEAFPSVRFADVKPEEADVIIDIADGASHATVAVGFVPGKTGGWFIHHLRVPVFSTDNTGASPIVFAEGDNISLPAAVDKLFDSLMSGSPDAFRSLMMLDKQSVEDVRKALDDTRARAMTCRTDRLRKLVPIVGKLPRGTTSLRVFVLAAVDDKKLVLDFEVVPGDPVRFRQFHCGFARETAKQPAK